LSHAFFEVKLVGDEARRQKWQRHQQLQDQKRNRNFQRGRLSDAGSAEENAAIFESLIFAGFVSGNWPVREKFQE
jgi:hypothetical protein